MREDEQSAQSEDTWDEDERRLEPRPATGEAPFDLGEVFFSRTDARGVIQAGNYVFRRVAHYTWEQLIGAPHKMIRHPDMPKAVFWLLWNTIQKGLPVGAYVKNRAEDGLHYWVFACVVPCEGGYLSARIKPSSGLLATVKAEYAELLKLEQEEGLTPEQSAQVLLGRIRDLGFEDYQRFEGHALSEELLARDRGLGTPETPSILRHRSMLDAAIQLKAATETLVRDFDSVKIIPHNMRAIASRLEPTGGPFRTLSGDYGKMSADISAWFESNVIGENSNFAAINSSVNTSMFLDGVTQILHECAHQLFSERRRHHGSDIETERIYLKALADRYATQSTDSQAVVRVEAERILAACGQMQRHILSLQSTRVLCKIESARMGAAGVGLEDIIGQLGQFQAKIAEHLGDVQALSEAIQAFSMSTDNHAKTASNGPGRRTAMR
ncbi:MAG: PAS domain-containing protein [Pseudomonadota bacterium]